MGKGKPERVYLLYLPDGARERFESDHLLQMGEEIEAAGQRWRVRRWLYGYHYGTPRDPQPLSVERVQVDLHGAEQTLADRSTGPRPDDLPADGEPGRDREQEVDNNTPRRRPRLGGPQFDRTRWGHKHGSEVRRSLAALRRTWRERESRAARDDKSAERSSREGAPPAEAEPPWQGQVFRDCATGRELMRETTAAIPVKVGGGVTIKGRLYTVAAVDGDEVLLDRA